MPINSIKFYNTRANAESSGVSSLSDGRGGLVLLNVDGGDRADIVYGASGISFPDVGGQGNLPGILVGLPGRVTSSNVRRERDTSYHVEAFYRFQLTLPGLKARGFLDQSVDLLLDAAIKE